MTVSNALAEFESKLIEQLHAANESAGAAQLQPAQVVAIVNNVLSKMMTGFTVSDLKFYAELREMARYIVKAKREISQMKPKDIANSHIPHATDQLEAVVGDAEKATNEIMDVCDAISGIADQCPKEVADKLAEYTGRIFEACSFQDITGQRINKVVQTFRYIDDKVKAMMMVLGANEEGSFDEPADPLNEILSQNQRREGLSGPALPKNAVDQEAIDRIMSDR